MNDAEKDVESIRSMGKLDDVDICYEGHFGKEARYQRWSCYVPSLGKMFESDVSSEDLMDTVRKELSFRVEQAEGRRHETSRLE